MTTFTSLPKVDERFSNKDISISDLNPYSSETTDILLEDTLTTEGNKIEVYKNLFAKQKQLNLVNKRPFCIWVNTRGIAFQVLLAEPVNPDSPTDIYQLLYRDYRGGIDTTYSDIGRNKIKHIQQSINTAIIDLNDISHVQLPGTPTEVMESTVKEHTVDLTKSCNEFRKWFVPVCDDLNKYPSQRLYRTYFNEFNKMEDKFVTEYGGLWKSEYDDFHNMYDKTWSDYKRMITKIYESVTGNDNFLKIKVYTDDDFAKVPVTYPDYESSFSETEFRNLMSAIFD